MRTAARSPTMSGWVTASRYESAVTSGSALRKWSVLVHARLRRQAEDTLPPAAWAAGGRPAPLEPRPERPPPRGCRRRPSGRVCCLRLGRVHQLTSAGGTQVANPGAVRPDQRDHRLLEHRRPASRARHLDSRVGRGHRTDSTDRRMVNPTPTWAAQSASPVSSARARPPRAVGRGSPPSVHG
jgi:hypothetical protein